LTVCPCGTSNLGARKSILGVGIACAAAGVLAQCAFSPMVPSLLSARLVQEPGHALGAAVGSTGQQESF